MHVHASISSCDKRGLLRLSLSVCGCRRVLKSEVVRPLWDGLGSFDIVEWQSLQLTVCVSSVVLFSAFPRRPLPLSGLCCLADVTVMGTLRHCTCKASVSGPPQAKKKVGDLL